MTDFASLKILPSNWEPPKDENKLHKIEDIVLVILDAWTEEVARKQFPRCFDPPPDFKHAATSLMSGYLTLVRGPVSEPLWAYKDELP